MPLDSWQRVQNLVTFARRQQKKKKKNIRRLALTAGTGLGVVGAAYGLSRLLPTEKRRNKNNYYPGTTYRKSSNPRVDPIGDLKYQEMDRFRTEQGYAKGKNRQVVLTPDQYARITERMRGL